MKLIDPLLGIKMIQGHTVLHLALFVCAWWVNPETPNDS